VYEQFYYYLVFSVQCNLLQFQNKNDKHGMTSG